MKQSERDQLFSLDSKGEKQLNAAKPKHTQAIIFFPDISSTLLYGK